MARGFSGIKRVNETIAQQNMKQTDYEHLERLYKHENARTEMPKKLFSMPPYCIGEKRKQWEQKQIKEKCTNTSI